MTDTPSNYCHYNGTHAVYFSFYHMAWVVDYEILDEDGYLSPTWSRWLIPVETVP